MSTTVKAEKIDTSFFRNKPSLKPSGEPTPVQATAKKTARCAATTSNRDIGEQLAVRSKEDENIDRLWSAAKQDDPTVTRDRIIWAIKKTKELNKETSLNFAIKGNSIVCTEEGQTIVYRISEYKKTPKGPTSPQPSKRSTPNL